MTRLAAPGRRPGFTLIELLVVIVIIALLMAFLIPAIAGAVRTARSAAVQAEISQLAQALADFKSKFGDYPPSRFMICEDGAYNTANATAVPSGANADVTYGVIAQRSVAAIRKFWPKVLVSGSSATVTNTIANKGWYDFNGNGVFNGSVTAPTGVGPILEGQECLVFFLGGIPSPVIDGAGNIIGAQGVTGFGKSTTNPFTNNQPVGTNYAADPNRSSPLFEFAADRLVVNPQVSTAVGYCGMPGYLDSLKSTSTQPLQNVYAYFSTNMGSGYDPNDVNFVGNPAAATPIPGPVGESDVYGATPLGLTFTQPLFGTTGTTTSPSPNPYTSSASTGTVASASGPLAAPVTYINNQTFQIISAGGDGVFGVGGIYSPNSTNSPLPREDSAGGAPYPYSASTDTTLRVLESDNLTNFHNGKLQ